MRVSFPGVAVLAVALASGAPAAAHHSNPLYFDMSNPITLEGKVMRVQPGIRIAARVFPPRNPLYVNDVQTVLLTKPDDPRRSARIVGAGQIRLSTGEILSFGSGAPLF